MILLAVAAQHKLLSLTPGVNTLLKSVHPDFLVTPAAHASSANRGIDSNAKTEERRKRFNFINKAKTNSLILEFFISKNKVFVEQIIYKITFRARRVLKTRSKRIQRQKKCHNYRVKTNFRLDESACTPLLCWLCRRIYVACSALRQACVQQNSPQLTFAVRQRKLR